jgi:hypothetical protein
VCRTRPDEYVDTDRAEVTVVQVHPGATSMEIHMRVVGERAAKADADVSRDGSACGAGTASLATWLTMPCTR